MSENGMIHISEQELDELMTFKAKALVGKMCKRFEILDDKELIKRELKELVYEEYRNVRELIIATSYGLGLTSFNFTSKGKTHSI